MQEIVLVCSAGMSTSLLVKSMEKVIAQRGMTSSLSVVSKPSTEALDYIELAPVSAILIGPHVRFVEQSLKEVAHRRQIPMAVMDSRVYGTMDGEKVIETALLLMEGEGQ